METWYYEVVSLDGDYANLRRTDIPSEDLKLVARAGSELRSGAGTASGGDYGRKPSEIRTDAVRDCGSIGRLRSDDRCGAGA